VPDKWVQLLVNQCLGRAGFQMSDDSLREPLVAYHDQMHMRGKN
jgi:hypothetical protein